MHTSFLLNIIAADAAIKVYKKVILRLGKREVAFNVRGGGLDWAR
jgi:hypothetical protein